VAWRETTKKFEELISSNTVPVYLLIQAIYFTASDDLLGKVVLVHTMKAYRGSKVIDSLILNVVARWV
jgi:hypothetical protein